MRNIKKTVRFSEDEWKIIMDKLEKTNLRFSDFVRISISKNRIKITSKSDEKMVFEINKIGVNLNQIARKINEGKTIDLEVLKELKNIHQLIKELLS